MARQAGTPGARLWGAAWLMLCGALALHVADEAANDFLAVYNPVAAAVRELWPLVVLPVFTFNVWIALLGAALIGLLCLAPFAFRGKRWMLPISYAFAMLMLANGVTHALASIYLGRTLPGLYSSPLLAVAAIFLLVAVRRAAAGRAAASSS